MSTIQTDPANIKDKVKEIKLTEIMLTENFLLPDEIFNEQISAIKQYTEHRAKVGEYIKIINKNPYTKGCNNGEIFKVEKRKLWEAGVYVSNADFKNIFVYDDEYVVLEDYRPEK